jgi:hypothetical protein
MSRVTNRDYHAAGFCGHEKLAVTLQDRLLWEAGGRGICVPG